MQPGTRIILGRTQACEPARARQLSLEPLLSHRLTERSSFPAGRWRLLVDWHTLDNSWWKTALHLSSRLAAFHLFVEARQTTDTDNSSSGRGGGCCRLGGCKDDSHTGFTSMASPSSGRGDEDLVWSTLLLLCAIATLFGMAAKVAILLNGNRKTAENLPPYAPGSMLKHIEIVTSKEYPWWILVSRGRGNAMDRRAATTSNEISLNMQFSFFTRPAGRGREAGSTLLSSVYSEQL